METNVDKADADVPKVDAANDEVRAIEEVAS